jgi:fumarate hydratase class II
VMIYNFLQSAVLLADACGTFTRYCVDGLAADRQRIQAYVENSLMLVTALSPLIGYDKCAEIAHRAFVEGTSLREACMKLGYLSGAEFDNAVVPARMTHP